VAVLAAAGLILGCGGSDDRAAAVPDDEPQATESVVAAPEPPPEPIDDPVGAFTELARQGGEDERTIAIARCTIEQVMEHNGKDAADTIVRVKRAQIANQPVNPKEIPVLAIMLQEAQGCAERHAAATGQPGEAPGKPEADAPQHGEGSSATPDSGASQGPEGSQG
jgi:hypothetical protein